ncbi:MAG: signal peptide peptidase SppA [Alphaproteobacteria bacterium]
MAFDADMRADRLRLKRHLSLWRGLFIVAALGFAILLLNRGGFSDGNRIARVIVEGVIVENRARNEALTKIADDPKVKAVIVVIDSPGGTVVGGEALYERLRTVAAKKPVVAIMGTVAASAAYMTAIAADRIYARQGTITGSIGVLMQTADITGLLAKLGITTEAIKTAPLKATPSPLEPMTDEVRAATRKVIDDMYGMFIEMIADRRSLSHDRVLELADGRVFTGRQAVEMDLIDAIGGEEEAKAWLVEKDSAFKDLPIRTLDISDPDEEGWPTGHALTWLIRQVFGEKMQISERVTLDGLIAVWHP